jgi:hypothetical protein
MRFLKNHESFSNWGKKSKLILTSEESAGYLIVRTSDKLAL